MPPPSTQPSSTEPKSCPHGPRAGTTTCLYCRNEARALARQKRNRVLARVGLVVAGGATALALIIGAIISIVPDGEPAGGGVTASADGSSPASGPDSSALILEPSIPEGRSTLGDSIVAERHGSDVTVHFDTEALRTRFDWKFEGVVRATLPLIFGPDARAALDSIRSGDFVRGGHLIRDLPTRGIPLALSEGRSLTVRPITRPGEDGPLVIGYRATATRN